MIMQDHLPTKKHSSSNFSHPTAWGVFYLRQMSSPAELWAYALELKIFAFFKTLLIISDGAAKFHLPMARYHMEENYKLFSCTDISLGLKTY